MPRSAIATTFFLLVVGITFPAQGDSTAPPDAGGDRIGHLKHVDFIPAKRQVRVECEALNVNAPLEFYCCLRGTNEHESVLRTDAKPSDIFVGLLAIGLKPGQPISYDEKQKKWIPPQGPPLYVAVEYEKDGKTVSYPAYRWLRDIKSKKEPKAFSWVFTGSRVMPDGKFAADVTGYVMSIVNFDLTLIDVPDLASSSNELLEWERNPDLMPKAGTKVWLVIEPAGQVDQKSDKDAADKAKGARSSADTPDAKLASAPADTQPTNQIIDLTEKRVSELRKYWQQQVAPKSAALRDAAEAHYAVINALRREQQRLIDEADRIQRTIDQLDKDYQELTTPHGAGSGS